MKIYNKFEFNDFYNHYDNIMSKNSKDRATLKRPSIKMLTWLIGFAEGDGSFLITSQNKTLGKHKITFLTCINPNS
jgi:hypothetical protein